MSFFSLSFFKNQGLVFFRPWVSQVIDYFFRKVQICLFFKKKNLPFFTWFLCFLLIFLL